MCIGRALDKALGIRINDATGVVLNKGLASR